MAGNRNWMNGTRARMPNRRVSLWAMSLLIAIACGATQPRATNSQESSSHSCGRERADIKARLTSLANSQTPAGGLVFTSGDEILARHPLIATLGLDLFAHEPSSLERIHDTVSRYAAYLLQRSDQDGDFVLERSSSGSHGALEDAGYNALLALDLLNLSRICNILDRPVDALYWYEGTQTIARQLIQQTFDSRSRFFLPMNNALDRREHLYYGLSVMPAYFNNHMGDHLAKSVLSHYAINKQRLTPESPHDYLTSESLETNGLSSTHALRTALLLAVLNHNGLIDAEGRFSDDISAWISTHRGSLSGSDGDRPYVEYFACLIANGGYRALLPKHHELDLFASVSSMHGVMPKEDLPELARNVLTLKQFLSKTSSHEPVTEAEIAVAETSMRKIYWAISSVRPRWRTRELFTPRDRGAIPGFDLYAAFDRLIVDVIESLRTVETRISTARAMTLGLDVAPTPLSETVIAGEPVRFRVALHAQKKSLDVTSVIIKRDEISDQLVGTSDALRLQSGDAPTEFWYQFVPADGIERLERVRFSVDVRLAGGKRLLYHYAFGVYLTNAIRYSLTFPQGKILTGTSVPVEIDVSKEMVNSSVINTQWYSPAGLVPSEGRSLELFLPEDAPRGKFKMNIPVPKPCRPGEFPFHIKVYGNGKELGVVSSNLFKHYEWVYVGPFPITTQGIDATYPPENSINLRQSYAGAIRPVSWMSLPEHTYLGTGEIDLTPMLPRESIGYLHTVIGVSLAKQTPLVLSTGQPAIVFVNGEEVLRVDESMVGSPQRVDVSLELGRNSILIKLMSGSGRNVFFRLGDGDGLAPDEFNNNMAELVDGYKAFKGRERDGVTEAQRVVTLTYSDAVASSVSVIGSFNGWSPVNANMRTAGSGRWEISLHLLPGRYSYRFLVNNTTHALDPNASLEEPDGYGGRNSVLLVR